MENFDVWPVGAAGGRYARRCTSLLFAALLLLAGCGVQGSSVRPATAPTATPLAAPKPTATYFLRFADAGRIEPAELQGHPGQLVKLVLVGGHRKHDLTSPTLNINIDVPPEQVEVITVELPAKAGTYPFWSAQPGDRESGMAGRFIVRNESMIDVGS